MVFAIKKDPLGPFSLFKKVIPFHIIGVHLNILYFFLGHSLWFDNLHKFINLGIMNALPIPGLDGSRFLFMLVEAIRRKPVAPEKEAMVHLAGMVFLFGVMIFFTFRDVLNLFR